MLACITSLAACGGTSGPAALTSGGASASASSDGGASAGTKAYHIGVNVWGTAPVLAAYGDEEEYAIKAIGMTDDRASDDNNADKELQNIQNFISAGVDGLCIQGAGATTVPQMGTEAKNAKVPFVLSIFTGTEDVRAELVKSNEYYMGAVASDLQADGRILAEKALADGCKTACIIGGNIGDLNMDNRSKGFTDGFKAGGGTILAEERCTDNSGALAKASSMLSANKEVNCIYIMVGDYVEGTLTALDTLGIEGVKCYLSAVNGGSAKYIADGQIVAGSGGTTLSCTVAPTLLMNALDGHPIKDTNGQAPFFQIPTSLVTKDNVDAYVKVFCAEGAHPVSADVLKSLCYRYNPQVTYQTYVDTIKNDLTVDAIIKASGK
ncbi:sugar ABC transporter substrate-binding protein [Sporobacter termitidis]|nr:substrate-binding domain-containing protein [Sporobacter termitidis]